MRGLAISLALLALLGAAGARAAPPRNGGGFRSYGEPMFETVFPDTEGFRKWVDQLVVVHERMEGLRSDFARAMHQVLVEVTRPLAAQEKPARRCQAAAEPFARAQRLGQDYLGQGRDLVKVYDQLTRLDEMGETAGLTSDYRAKVHRARDVYRGLKSDYREMKYTFHEQLIPELKHAGCDPNALVGAVAKGAKAPATMEAAAAPALTTIPPQALPKRATGETPPRPATMITFHVDNTHCRATVRLTVDGAAAGEVPAQSRGAFRSRSGPHELCLLHDTSPAKCGQPGTVRKTYLHDGWTIQLRCPK
jgi:hypothetical protein